MMVEATLGCLCSIFPTGDTRNLGEVMYGITLFIKLHMPNGLPVEVTQVYTYREPDEFLKYWGHIEEFEAGAVAVKSGLIDRFSMQADITERGIKVEDIG